MNTNFYADLPSITNFYNLMRLKSYSRVPDDWYLVITDIKGSTKAIEAGRYKDVNFVGAMGIVALLNLAKEIEIPFLFGGDGASVFIPASLYEQATLSLNNLRNIVQTHFNLELRIALLRVSEIYESAHEILITKHRISPYYTQAIVRGGGLEYADALIKKEYEKYALARIECEENMADFNSLECRWEEISSPKDEVLTLLIKAKNDTEYQKLFEKLESIFGSYEERHPIKEKNLHLSFSPKNLRVEASLLSISFFAKSLRILSMMGINLLGGALMAFKVGLWGEYKHHITQTCDTQKFDDMFRSVISATKSQTRQLELYLQTESQLGNLSYGIHKSDTSLMTCLIFDRHGKHVHFVDGSDGGYALAAKMMKMQSSS